MLRQSQRTTPESEAEEFGSSDDLFGDLNVAAGVRHGYAFYYA